MNEERKPDKYLVAVSTALVSLTRLLRYANEPNYMDDYDAACEASEGIRALTDVLKDLNL